MGHGGDPIGTAADPAGVSLCLRFPDLLPVTGASISVAGREGESVVGATDTRAARLEQLQFDLGAGPHGQGAAHR